MRRGPQHSFGGAGRRGAITTDESKWTPWLRDAAILLAAAPATLFLLGWSWKGAYLTRLGVHDTTAFGEVHELMVKGFWLLLLPSLVVGLILLIAWAPLLRKRPKPDDNPLRFLAVVAAASLFAAGYSFAQIGDDTPNIVPFVEFTLFDLLVAVLFASLAGWVLIAITHHKDTILARMVGGHTPSGGLFLVLLMVMGLAVHATSGGTDLGSDRAWGCTSFPAIRLDAPQANITTDEAYLLIAHAGGSYYLRDSRLPGDEVEVLVVPDAVVLQAHLFRHDAVREC